MIYLPVKTIVRKLKCDRKHCNVSVGGLSSL